MPGGPRKSAAGSNRRLAGLRRASLRTRRRSGAGCPRPPILGGRAGADRSVVNGAPGDELPGWRPAAERPPDATAGWCG